jgi:hypothetical protein
MRQGILSKRMIGVTALLAALLLPGATLTAQSLDPAMQGQAQPAPEEHPLTPAIRYAESSLDAVEQLNDYTATLTKRELIDGRLITQVMNLKFRDEPFSVYLQYGEPHSGREILYVHGRNQNQILAHEGQGLGALAGTLNLDPTGQRAMAENRHPVTDLGLKRMLELVLEQWNIESQFGEIDVRYYPDARLGNITCQVIETAHPRPRRQFRYQTSRVYFDEQSHLPIRIENFGFPQNPAQQPPLVEEYTYLNVQPNVGLDDRDFDDRNPAYRFR